MSSRLLRPGIRLLEIYSHQAKTRPLTTMSITAGISMGLGSWTCQLIFVKYSTMLVLELLSLGLCRDIGGQP